VTELEMLTMKMMAFTIVMDTAAAKGIVPPSDLSEIDRHCSIVIGSFTESARQIIASYDRNTVK